MTKQEKLKEIQERSFYLEKTIIGALFVSPRKFVEISQIVDEHSFLSQKYQDGFNIARLVAIESKDLTDVLRQKGYNYTDFVSEEVLVGRELKDLAQSLRKTNLTYKVFTLLDEGLQDVALQNIDDFIGVFQKRFADASRLRGEEETEIADILKAYQKHQEEYAAKIQEGQKLLGFSCGFEKIDKIIDGLRPTHLWIVGGYTSTGKTFWSINVVKNAIEQGKRVAFYSLEMSKIDIVSRILGVMSKINGTSVLKGILPQPEASRVHEAKAVLEKSGMSIYSDLRDLHDIELSMIREMSREKPADLFVLDYLQLVTVAKAQTEYDVMRLASAQFQAIAKRLNVPIILLSQVSNEAVRSPNAQIIGFKGAGNIAAAADLAVELLPDEQDPEAFKRKLANGEPVSVKCVVKKNRHGRVGSFPMEFDGRTGLFVEDFTV